MHFLIDPETRFWYNMVGGECFTGRYLRGIDRTGVQTNEESISSNNFSIHSDRDNVVSTAIGKVRR